MALDIAPEQDPNFVGPVRPPPEEMEQRKSGWRNLLSKWDDPNVKQAIMQFGIGLMKRPSFGQNGWDVGANALQAGVGKLTELRERDRLLGEAKRQESIKEQQRVIENTRGDRQVAATEKNAESNAAGVDIQRTSVANADTRGNRELTETERRNKANEQIERDKTAVLKTRADAYAQNRVGRTPADIEKLNRLQQYYIQSEGLDEVTADKRALDYMNVAKNRAPQDAIMASYQAKVKDWSDRQMDPTAQLPPELAKQFAEQAQREYKLFVEAGQALERTTGGINRTPGTGTPPPAPSVPPVSGAPPEAGIPPTAAPQAPAPVAPPQAAAAPPAPQDPRLAAQFVDNQNMFPSPKPPSIPAQPTPMMDKPRSEATTRSIDIWKARGATPEQIKILIAIGGENPLSYGY